MGSTVDRILSETQQGTPPANFDQKPGKVDSILSARPSVDSILSGSDVPYDPNRLAPKEVPAEAFPEPPSKLKLLLDILKEQGKGLVQFGKYAITTPGFNPALPITTSGEVGKDITAAAQGDQDAELRLRRGLNGAALTASTFAGEGALAGIPKGVTLLPRFARWFAAQEAGAVTYGAIQPLDSDETRSQVIADDMVQFPIAGAVLHGIFSGLGKLFKGFSRIDPEVASELRNMGKEEATQVGKEVEVILRDVGDVPPGAEPVIQSAAVNDATRKIVGQRRPTTITARVVGETHPPTGPDFTVEANKPPEAKPTPPIPRNKITGEPLTEHDLLAEMGGSPVEPDLASARIQNAIDLHGPDWVSTAKLYSDIPEGITLEHPSLDDVVAKQVVSMVRTGEGKVGAGFDPTLFKKLGANMYKSDIASVALKEGLQNSVDATRGIPGALINFKINSEDRSIEITDNGTGMSPEIAANQFMDIGGSAKGLGSSGGYGLAKVGQLANAEHFEMRTVANTPEGKKLTTIKGSALDWASGNLDYETSPALADEPTGTRLYVKFDQDAKVEWDRARYYLQNATFYHRGSQDIKVDWDGSKIYSPYDAEKINYDQPKIIDKPNATITIYPSEKSVGSGGGYVSLQVLNTGAYQFRSNKYVKQEMPRTFVVNIEPKVEVDSPDYPFTTSREEIKGDVSDAIEKFFSEAGNLAAKEQIRSLKNNLIKSPIIASTKYRVVGSQLESELKDKIASRPYAADITKLLDKATSIIYSTIKQIRPNIVKPIFGGLGIEKEYLGINILSSAINKVALEAGEEVLPFNDNIILYNPFTAYSEIFNRIEDRGGIPYENLDVVAQEWADDAWGTMVHEVVHQLARGHDEEFAGQMTRVLGRTAVSAVDLTPKLKETFLDAISRAEWHTDLDEVKNAFAKSKEGFWRQFSGHQESNLPGSAEIGSGPRSKLATSTNVAQSSEVRRPTGRGNVQSSSEGKGLVRDQSSDIRGDTPDGVVDLVDYVNQNPESVLGKGALADAVSDEVASQLRPKDIMSPELVARGMKELEINKVLPIEPEQQDVGMSLNTALDKLVEEGAGPDMKGLVTNATKELRKDWLAKRGSGKALKYSDIFKKLASNDPANKENYLDLAALARGYEKEKQPLGGIGQIGYDPGNGPEAKGNWYTLDEQQLDALRNIIERFLNSDTGAITGRAAARIAALSLSGVSFYAADQQEDPQARALLNGIGGILAVGALVPGVVTKQWLKDSKWSYWFLKGLDIGRVATDGTKEGLHNWQGLTSQGRAFAKNLENKLRPVFPDKASKEAAMFALDEGPRAPEWHTLTKAQQLEVVSQSILNARINGFLRSLGIAQDGRVNYIKRLFADYKTQSLWYATWQSLGKPATLAQQARFGTLREAINWAKTNGLPEPILDPVMAQPFYSVEASKAIANVKLQQQYEKLGLLLDYDPLAVASTANLSPNKQLRRVRVSLPGGAKMAPDDAATVLERAATGAQKFGLEHEYLTAVDQARGQLMRSIMFWAWEHGINVTRAAYALDGTGTMYRHALRQVRSADPVVVQVAKYADLFRRPDFGPEGQGLFDKVLHNIGQAAPTLKKIGVGLGDFRARGERRLWDEMVPALGIAAWTREMHKWADRTGGKYLLGSPEYEAAARQAGKFANNAMGKVPELVTSPGVAYVLRQIFFSPNWTRTRLSTTAHAAGELVKIAGGEINPNEATYLGYKLRSVLVGAVVTIVGSLLLTGRLPKFNPNTQKFYMLTDVKDQHGREMGVDLTGWWQDDLKVFNDPFAYLRDRQSPMLRAVGTQLSGRDVFGRSITGIERVENLFQSIGPGGELVSSAASAISGEFGGAEALKAASGVLAAGNVSSLPRLGDAIVSKKAAKLLRQAGLPTDRDRVYILGQMMKQNFTQTGTLYGGEINTWIAYQRIAYTRRGIPWLWQEGKKVLRTLIK